MQYGGEAEAEAGRAAKVLEARFMCQWQGVLETEQLINIEHD